MGAKEIFETVKTLVIAGLAAMFIHSFLFAPFWIPSGSMVPTLLVGDYLFINKFAYGFSRYSLPFAPDLWSGRIGGHAPRRGDVVVFVSPSGSGEVLVKRIIGLPGDTVQISNGLLYINGALVPRTDEGSYVDDSDGGPVVGERFKETLPNGRVHDMLKLSDAPEVYSGVDANNTPVYTVPAGDYFMLGDNRDNSEDSRFLDGPVGFVPAANLLGPAVMVLGSMDVQAPGWEFWEWPFELRYRRFFKLIH
ncbi:signal peptidase I [Acidocella sp.]|uniref:signal peptidase I n=3 Tax=Acidocella sp. TaxID=50710 RepID=UPI00260E7B65|nr:signal peptidase I [Acidocella sp.]